MKLLKNSKVEVFMKIDKIYSKKDNLALDIAVIEPKGIPKAIVQFSHGMSEHKERYFDFMNNLVDNGYICIIHDHRGHGTSVKDKHDLGYFYTEDINYIVDDLYQVTEYVKDKYPDLDVILFSHSMGTLVARNYLKKYDDKITKLVLCGPPTENPLAGLGIWIAKVLKLFYKKNTPNKLLNTMTFGKYNTEKKIANAWVCSDKEQVEKYNNDVLCGYIFSTNGFINLFELMKEAFQPKGWQMKNENLPIFLIAGEEDPVIQNVEKFHQLIEFLKKRGYKDTNFKLYEGMRHELLNETNKQLVYEDILEFINEGENK